MHARVRTTEILSSAWGQHSVRTQNGGLRADSYTIHSVTLDGGQQCSWAAEHCRGIKTTRIVKRQLSAIPASVIRSVQHVIPSQCAQRPPHPRTSLFSMTGLDR